MSPDKKSRNLRGTKSPRNFVHGDYAISSFFVHACFVRKNDGDLLRNGKYF